MQSTAADDMAKKADKQPGSKTVRIDLDAYKAARRVASLRAIDLGGYVSQLILAHAPKDLRIEIHRLGED